MSQGDEDEIEASRAPLLDHLIELRSRLIKAIVAVLIAFVVCFAFAKHIYNILIIPYEWASNWTSGPGHEVRLIYTAPQEFFITQIKLAVFGALFIAFPVIAAQIYKFVAPGLYKNERKAFLPYLIATPILFIAGALVVFFILMPLAMRFFLSLQQQGGPGEASIELLPKVNEYLSLITSSHSRVRRDVPIAGGADVARPHRRHHQRHPQKGAPLCHRACLHRGGDLDPARHHLATRSGAAHAAALRGLDFCRPLRRAQESPGGRGPRGPTDGLAGTSIRRGQRLLSSRRR